MHFAAAAGHAEVIRQLAFYMACHPDCPDPDDRTPLHWAAAMGHAQCVQVLLDLGVKVNVKDVDGGTPLTYAKQSAHEECVRLLEEALNIPAGDSSNKKTLEGEGGGGGGGKRGRTPLEFLKGLFLSPRKDNSGSHTSAPSRLRPPPSPLLSSSPRALQSSPSSSLTGSPVRPLPSPGCGPERVTLPSIHTKTTSLSEGAAATDPSVNTASSFPFDVNAKCVEPEQAEEKEKPVKGEKVMKYRATHIPALPPLLPDLVANADPAQRDTPQRDTGRDIQRDTQQDSQQESRSQAAVSEGERSTGPLRCGPPPQIRQLNTRAANSLHDGMRSIIDLRLTDCQYSSSPRPPAAPFVSQGMKGSKKRGLPPQPQPPPPNYHPPPSQQSSSDVAGSETGSEGMMVMMKRKTKAEDSGHPPQRGGLYTFAQLQGVVAPSSVSTSQSSSGVPVVEGSSVVLSHGSRVTLPHCSSGSLLQESGNPPHPPPLPRPRVSRSDSSRCLQPRVALPQCPNVPLTQGSFGAPTSPGSFVPRGSSSGVPGPKDSSAGSSSLPQRSSNSRDLVIDDISNASSLPNISPSLSCPSSSVSLVGKDRSSGTCQKSDLKLVDI